MTSKRIHDNIIYELKARVKTLENRIGDIRNDRTVNLPIKVTTDLPEDAGEGDVILGDDSRAYKYQDGEWSLISAGLIEVVTTPGFLSVFDGTAPGYMLTNGTIRLVHCAIGVVADGPVGVELAKNGTVVGSTAIPTGQKVSTSMTPSPATFVVGDYFTVNITSVGTTAPGKDLVVKLF